MAKPREAHVMNGRTAARVKQLAQASTPANVRGHDTSSGRQVVWLTVTGEPVADEGEGLDGWYPCRVEIGADGEAFAEFGHSLCRHHKGEPLAVGYRYMGLRQNPKGGESRFLAIGRTAYTSADGGLGWPSYTTFRRDGFNQGFGFSPDTPRINYGSYTYLAIDISESALTVPVAGWYDVDLRLNAAVRPQTVGGQFPGSWNYIVKVIMYRVEAGGARGYQLLPFDNQGSNVLVMSGGSFPYLASGAQGSYSFRGTFYFPDDQRGLRVMLHMEGGPLTENTTTSFARLSGELTGSLHAELAGPRIDPPEPPSAGSNSEGEAIADGEPYETEPYIYTLDGTASYPPTGETITAYGWSVLCPDSTTVTSSAATFTNEYDPPGDGEYVATLTVTFSDSTTKTDTHNFTLPNPEPPDPGSIDCLVFGDADADGVQDVGDSGLIDRYVEVDGIDVVGGGLSPTDATGHAVFSDLVPGTYQVNIYYTSLGAGEFVTTTHPQTVTIVAGATTNTSIGIASLGSGGAGEGTP